MSANYWSPESLKENTTIRFAQSHAHGGAAQVERLKRVDGVTPSTRGSLLLCGKQPSSWSRSGVKRLFDCSCVLLSLPLLAPVLLVIALAVWLTSTGPIFFLQKRVGRHGRTFTILKFRTMIHAAKKAHHAVTTVSNQRFTLIGPFLRRWKLDELPQLLNVLWGDMSLVGPRPKMPEHVIFNLLCRPGITGAATVAFAREEAILDAVPRHLLESYVHTVVLPIKRGLDADYMAEATFVSDFKLILKSILRRWDSSIAEELLDKASFETRERKQPRKLASSVAYPSGIVPSHLHSSVPANASASTEELVIS